MSEKWSVAAGSEISLTLKGTPITIKVIESWGESADVYVVAIFPISPPITGLRVVPGGGVIIDGAVLPTKDGFKATAVFPTSAVIMETIGR
jgi:hypothetical protein